jgi:hypothetical protein
LGAPRGKEGLMVGYMIRSRLIDTKQTVNGSNFFSVPGEISC